MENNEIELKNKIRDEDELSGLLAAQKILDHERDEKMLDYVDIKRDLSGKIVRVDDTLDNAEVLFKEYDVSIANNEMSKILEIDIPR